MQVCSFFVKGMDGRDGVSGMKGQKGEPGNDVISSLLLFLNQAFMRLS